MSDVADPLGIADHYRLPKLHLAAELTTRQLQMIQLMAFGLDKGDIADLLRLEPTTVYSTFNAAESRLRRVAIDQRLFAPQFMTTPMWTRWGVLLGLDQAVGPRP